MSSIICDMDCDQETNKSIIEKHCSDCLCMGKLADGNHGHVPARKARRSTNVVEERGRFNTLSFLEMCHCLTIYNMFEYFAAQHVTTCPGVWASLN